jgi:hypothetical protein
MPWLAGDRRGNREGLERRGVRKAVSAKSDSTLIQFSSRHFVIVLEV